MVQETLDVIVIIVHGNIAVHKKTCTRFLSDTSSVKYVDPKFHSLTCMGLYM